MFTSTFYADWVVTNDECVFIGSVFVSGESAGSEVMIVCIVSAICVDISAYVLYSLGNTPKIGEIEALGNYLLHNLSVHGVFIYVAIVVLWIETTLHELVFAIVEHLAVDFGLCVIFSSFVGCVNCVEYDGAGVEHVTHSS